MHDIRDLISNTPHVARIVFGSQMTHVQHDPHREEKRMHYYVGAASGDRFVLIEIPSPEAANEPIDLLIDAVDPDGRAWERSVGARTTDTDYHFNHPMITPRPRASVGSPQDRAIRIGTRELQQCLRFGLYEIGPGSIRWEGDHFTAEFSEEYKKTTGSHRVSFGGPGEIAPESVKEKFLERLLNPPPVKDSRPGGFTLSAVSRDHPAPK